MRKSIILAVVLAVAFVAVPAFASVQNVKVSGSIDSTYLFRDNFDLGTNADNDETQSLFITQTTIQIDADLTDQVSATVALINERAWGNDNIAGTGSTETDIDLSLAYVTLREMLYSPLTVVIGRQAFSYGNSLIVDSAGTNNLADNNSGLAGVAADLSKQTAQDAIRLIFDYNPLTLEVLYAKLNSNTVAAAADDKDDVDLYGVNATYELGDDLNTQIETYFFARIDKSTTKNASDTTSNGSKADTLYVPGLRASADILDGLNVQGEIAWQSGTNVSQTSATDVATNNNERRDAMAAQVISNYQIPNDVLPDALEEFNPALQYVFTYVSGDSNPADRSSVAQNSTNSDNAWDPLLENQGGGTIYNAIFDLTNAHIHTIALTTNPMEDVTSTISWTGLWLDKETDAATAALRSPDGTGRTAVTNEDESDIGYEVDVNTVYDYTEDVQFGLRSGWFVPGDVFTEASDDIASQIMLHANVDF